MSLHVWCSKEMSLKGSYGGRANGERSVPPYSDMPYKHYGRNAPRYDMRRSRRIMTCDTHITRVAMPVLAA
jgi:hypothetical protein